MSDAQEPFRVTPEMLAAAWSVVRGRYPTGRVLGPGPGFAEAIQAAFDAMPLAPRPVAGNERTEGGQDG